MELIGKPTVNPFLFYPGKASVVAIVSAPFLAILFPYMFNQEPPVWLVICAWIIYAASLLIVVVASMELGESLRVGLPSGKTGLKTGGLYAISRNPIYTVFYPLCLAVSVLAPNPVVWMMSIFSLFVHHRIILSEEKFLANRFARKWKDYCRKVSRYA